MSEDDLNDEYDDEDDSIFEDEEEGDESEGDFYDVENGEDDEDDLEDEYEEYDQASSCFVCSVDAEYIPEEARWKFAVSDDEGDRVEFWTCKSCRAKFASLEDFDQFRTDWTRSSLYRCAATLQRLILLKAPDCLVANAAFVIAGYLFNEDAEGLKPYAVEELKKLTNRVGGKE